MDKKDYYKDYNHEKYAHFRLVKVGGFDAQDVESEKGKRKRFNPRTEKRIIPFEEIKSLKLDEYGTLCPQLDTEDYIVIGNYLLDFWGAVLGSDAVLLYQHLKRYAFGKKDFCFPDLEMIGLKMGKSPNTVKKYLSILEDNHFIAKFNRYDVTDNNREVSPFFKIRRYVPLLTQDMVNELPPKLQELHEKFMDEYSGLSLTNELTEQTAVVNEMTIGKEIIANKHQRKKIQAILNEEDNYQYIIKNLDDDSRYSTEFFHDELIKHISKPSYETWIEKLLFIPRNGKWIIACPNTFILEWVQGNYQDVFREHLSTVELSKVVSSKFEKDSEMEFVLMEEVIEKMFTSRA
ncbi:DnaA N-terminal domain-containing protein [Bacillus gaemokensis]|uniref:DnaA N-terminal domain-containing protein n=1 Tax=Bacillus gaemokensis TaxID=574375 RepID=A0A073KBN8_9BACI|nr:DnaA N-terminal domain-containing protein [Bacillus gaemokensis]KEK23965.1 hypothetical protein BAGA_06025 [Bacillus gaemokensis]KYG38086.1 hypothetical protein AZF08_20255 [Bacillus gaemokensis]